MGVAFFGSGSVGMAFFGSGSVAFFGSGSVGMAFFGSGSVGMAFFGSGSVGVAFFLESSVPPLVFVGVALFGRGSVCGVLLGVPLVGVVLGVVFSEWDKMLFLFLDEGVLRAMSSLRFSSRCRTSAIVGLSSAGFQHNCMMSYLYIDHSMM